MFRGRAWGRFGTTAPQGAGRAAANRANLPPDRPRFTEGEPERRALTRAADQPLIPAATANGSLTIAQLGVAQQQPAAASPPRIDVKELMAASSLEELNRKAEEYFASISDREPHLAKPFASAQGRSRAPDQFSTLLQGLRLWD